TPGPHTDTSLAQVTESFVGTNAGTVSGLHAATMYSFLCRASDLTGNEDTNTVEKSATTLDDTTPPTFDGSSVAAALDTPSTSAVKITWSQASDDQLAPNQIIYDVYQSSTPGGEDFSATPAAEVVGVTEAIVNLTSRTTAYWIVRAKDSAGNDDGNNF